MRLKTILTRWDPPELDSSKLEKVAKSAWRARQLSAPSIQILDRELDYIEQENNNE